MLALSALVGGILVFWADTAMAGYTARVDAGTLDITGDAASDTLLLVSTSTAA